MAVGGQIPDEIIDSWLHARSISITNRAETRYVIVSSAQKKEEKQIEEDFTRTLNNQ